MFCLLVYIRFCLFHLQSEDLMTDGSCSIMEHFFIICRHLLIFRKNWNIYIDFRFIIKQKIRVMKNAAERAAMHALIFSKLYSFYTFILRSSQYILYKTAKYFTIVGFRQQIIRHSIPFKTSYIWIFSFVLASRQI